MANRLASVGLGQCAAARNAHFQLAKVIEPRRYPARALTRFARRRGRTRLLPALAPHRVSRNRCEERVPLVLRNGHATLLSIHGVRASQSHEKQAPEPGKPARPSGSGCPPPGVVFGLSATPQTDVRPALIIARTSCVSVSVAPSLRRCGPRSCSRDRQSFAIERALLRQRVAGPRLPPLDSPTGPIPASSSFEIVTERVDELSICFRDPDGHLLELATPVAGILR